MEHLISHVGPSISKSQSLEVTQLRQTSVVPQSLLNSFLLTEQYAAASYCDYNNNLPQGGRRIACDNDVCPDLDPLDQITEYEFVQ